MNSSANKALSSNSFKPSSLQKPTLLEEKFNEQKPSIPSILSTASPKILESTFESMSETITPLSTEMLQAETIINEDSLHEGIVQPKIKIKTRSPSIMTMEARVEAKEKEAALTLPEQLKTEEFNSFIESLVTETKPNKLKNLFKTLNDFGVFAENNEKNNKGYFCIKSPITHQLHVRTYHHLHQTENHYASIFMAVRQVLVAADILER